MSDEDRPDEGDVDAAEGDRSPDLTDVDGVGPATAAALREAGYRTVTDVTAATRDELTDVEGIGSGRADRITAGAERVAGDPDGAGGDVDTDTAGAGGSDDAGADTAGAGGSDEAGTNTGIAGDVATEDAERDEGDGADAGAPEADNADDGATAGPESPADDADAPERSEASGDATGDAPWDIGSRERAEQADPTVDATDQPGEQNDTDATDPTAGDSPAPDPTAEFETGDDREGDAPDDGARPDDTRDDQGPLGELAGRIRDRAEAATDPEDDPFEEVEDAEIDVERVWESLDEGGAPDSEPASTEGFSPDGTEHVIAKRTYCQQCEYFSAPPDVVCAHEGTRILEVVDDTQFRVRDCPKVAGEELGGIE